MTFSCSGWFTCFFSFLCGRNVPPPGVGKVVIKGPAGVVTIWWGSGFCFRLELYLGVSFLLSEASSSVSAMGITPVTGGEFRNIRVLWKQ